MNIIGPFFEPFPAGDRWLTNTLPLLAKSSEPVLWSTQPAPAHPQIRSLEAHPNTWRKLNERQPNLFLLTGYVSTDRFAWRWMKRTAGIWILVRPVDANAATLVYPRGIDTSVLGIAHLGPWPRIPSGLHCPILHAADAATPELWAGFLTAAQNFQTSAAARQAVRRAAILLPELPPGLRPTFAKRLSQSALALLPEDSLSFSARHEQL